MTVTVCMCALHAASSLAHMQERFRSGALGGDGGGAKTQVPARPFPLRRRTVAASVAAWPIEFNPRLSIDLSSSDAPKELFPKGQVAL